MSSTLKVESAPAPEDPCGSRLEFERLISDTSASLFAQPIDSIHHAVEQSLARVRTFFEADRCVLMSVSSDMTLVKAVLESSAEGVPHLPSDVNLAESFPWAAQTLFVEHAAVIVTDRDAMPAAAHVDRQSLTELGIRAALVVPVESDGVVTHLIVLNVLGRDRDWPAALITRLQGARRNGGRCPGTAGVVHGDAGG